jgi:hypothetical protein
MAWELGLRETRDRFAEPLRMSFYLSLAWEVGIIERELLRAWRRAGWLRIIRRAISS